MAFNVPVFDTDAVFDEVLFGGLVASMFETEGTFDTAVFDYYIVPPTGTIIKYWTGTAWGNGNVKRWDGSTWVDATVKRWTGSAWVDL